MGVYAIDCPNCGKRHNWFSASTDQRCSECIAERATWNVLVTRLVRTIKLALDTCHTPTFLSALEDIE